MNPLFSSIWLLGLGPVRLKIVDGETTRAPENLQVPWKPDLVVAAHAVSDGHVTVIIILFAADDPGGCAYGGRLLQDWH
jgi:hypothetical protein